jgi:single-stranded DNA-binding protein
MLNSSFLIGKIASPPIITRDHNDKPKALFALSSHREYNNSKDEHKTEIVTARIQAFGKLALLVESHQNTKSFVLVKGRLTNESKHSHTLIVTAEHLDFGLSDMQAQVLSE